MCAVDRSTVSDTTTTTTHMYNTQQGPTRHMPAPRGPQAGSATEARGMWLVAPGAAEPTRNTHTGDGQAPHNTQSNNTAARTAQPRLTAPTYQQEGMSRRVVGHRPSHVQKQCAGPTSTHTHAPHICAVAQGALQNAPGLRAHCKLQTLHATPAKQVRLGRLGGGGNSLLRHAVLCDSRRPTLVGRHPAAQGGISTQAPPTPPLGCGVYGGGAPRV